MKRKDYERPKTRAMGIGQRGMLMASQTQTTGTPSYTGFGEEEDWGDGAGVKAHGNYFDWDND